MKGANLYVDQYGHFHLADSRKKLAEQLGYAPSSLRPMYTDTTSGETYRVGYVVGGLWLTALHVEPVRIPA